MADKKTDKRHPAHRSSQQKSSAHDFYTPFKNLDQHLGRVSAGVSPSNNNKSPAAIPQRWRPLATPEAVETSGEAERVFKDAMADVSPPSWKGREIVPAAPPPKKPARFLEQEEMEVYAQLVDLVEGEGPFEVSWTDEYVDGAIVGLSPKILGRLRRGEFSYQAYTDLHGCKKEEGREKSIRFVKQSFALRHRCILIVSGRGLNSKDKEPVLKQGLVRWLTRAPLKRFVLAFASARAYDGGAGAFYVLLRRNEGNTPLVTPAI